MAALWKLPVVYVIENNRYGMGTSVRPRLGRPTCASAAAPTAFPASRSTAWTWWRSRRPADEAVSHARAGEGPIILEMMTYRYRGHSMSDPAKYRTKEEVTRCGRRRPDRQPPEADRSRTVGRRGRAEGDRPGDQEHRHRSGGIRRRMPRARPARAVDRRAGPKPERNISLRPSGSADRKAPPLPRGRRRPRLGIGAGGTGMPIEILMPALSPTMTEGKIARWVKRRATTSGPATCSPRSRPTRRRWRSRRSTRASWARS